MFIIMICKKIIDKIVRKYQHHCNSKAFKTFGDNSNIIKPSRIVGSKYIEIGNNVNLYHGLRLEAVDKWNGVKFTPSIIFADNVGVQQNCHITCAVSVTVGKYTSILPCVMITDITHQYKDITVPPGYSDIVVSPVSIGEYCMIGFGSAIMPGVHIGNNCIVGANSVVTHDLPDGSVAIGNPARIIKKYNHYLNKWEKVDDVSGH